MICGKCSKEIGDAAVCPFCHTEQKKTQPYYLPAGTVINKKYVIKSVLGEGGFGVTYLGRDTFFECDVAIKEYYPHGFSYRNTKESNDVYVSPASAADFFEHGKKRFLSEGKTLVKFRTEPGVVSVVDFVEENNTAYLVMEYLEGVTLQQYLKQYGVMRPDEVFALFEPVMRTLEKIHAAGVIHRDISPDNIMRLISGQLKLMDFGAAKEYIDENRSMSVILKQGYAPIEQYRRGGKQGPWTDVYALCATIYRCITGVTPPDALDRVMEDTLQKPSQLGVVLAPATENVLLYGLTVRAENRCQSMTELIGLFAQAKQMAPPPAPYAPSFTPPYTPPYAPPAPSYTPSYTPPPAPQYVQPVAPPAPKPVKDDTNATIYADADLPETEPVKAEKAPAPVKVNTPSPEKEKAPVSEEKEPKKKTGKARWIGAVAVILILAIVIGLVAVKPWKSKSSDVSNASSNSDASDTVTNSDTSDAEEKEWSNITAIAAGRRHTVGLKEDGTVVATGDNEHGQCDVSSWTDIVAVAAGDYHTVGLKEDGTVVATGWNEYGQCGVDNWTDIAAVAAGYAFTVGLKKDGTVVATGWNYYGQCDVGGWTDIVAVAAGDWNTVGLKKDGTVVVIGWNDDGQSDVSSWTDIVAVSAGQVHTIGIKKDGTVVATGKNNHGQCDVGGWKDIIAVAAGSYHTVGLKEDGTVVATGHNGNGQCDVDDWTDIVAVAAGSRHTVGLKEDGTVVATGWNDDGQCDVDK